MGVGKAGEAWKSIVQRTSVIAETIYNPVKEVGSRTAEGQIRLS